MPTEPWETNPVANPTFDDATIDDLTVTDDASIGDQLTIGGKAGIGSPLNLAAASKLTLGSDVADTKLAIFDLAGIVGGIGVQAADLRMHAFGVGSKISLRTASAGASIAEFHTNDLRTQIHGWLDHDGTNVGFYGTPPIAKQTGVPITAAGVHAALVALGLIAA